jgi:hypothetical protein
MEVRFILTFGIADILAALPAKALSVVCYGPCIQHQGVAFAWNMGVLRATLVCSDDYIEAPYKENRYTELKFEYEDAAEDYNIPNFEPHPDPCDACP